MKPKMYRKSKPSGGSDIASFKATEAGGPVTFVDGPETSVGQKSGPGISHPTPDQGNEKGIKVS